MRFFDLALIPTAPVRRALAVAFAGVVLALAGCVSTGDYPANAIQQPKNIIILFADGASSTQWDFGRYSSKVLRNQPFVTTDIVFKNGTLGLLSTHPSDAYVVDSAAAGSAMSTGHKVNNAAVAMTPDGKEVPTAMEVAKARGKRIGLVTTATVYDATPAAFSLTNLEMSAPVKIPPAAITGTVLPLALAKGRTASTTSGTSFSSAKAGSKICSFLKPR